MSDGRKNTYLSIVSTLVSMAEEGHSTINFKVILQADKLVNLVLPCIANYRMGRMQEQLIDFVDYAGLVGIYNIKNF